MSRRIVVAHVVEALAGGIATYVGNVLPELVQRGFGVSLIYSPGRGWPGTGKLLKTLEAAGVSLHVVAMSRTIRPLADLRLVLRVSRLLRAMEADVVHAHCSKAGAVGRAAAALARTRLIVYTPHCLSFARCPAGWRRWTYRAMERCLGRITHRLVAVSRSEASLASRSGILSAAKCVVVPNGLSPMRPSQEAGHTSQAVKCKRSFGLAGDERVVSTACRLVEYKGLREFLNAAGASVAESVVFLIAGDGELRPSLQREIRSRRLEQKVRLLGHVDRMEDLYAATDVFVLCSRAEGQPYVLLEAMRARSAVVAVRAPGVEELVRHGRRGLLTERNEVSLAAAIDALLADENLRSRCADAGYRYWQSEHSLERQVSGLTGFYHEGLLQRVSNR